jgi:cleavage and polyadenylation specificity factor subunit 3
LLIKYAQTVDSSSDALRRRVEAVLEMAASTVSSLSESFVSGAPEEFTNGDIHKASASPAAEMDERVENASKDDES